MFLRFGVYGRIGIKWCLKTPFRIPGWIKTILFKQGSIFFCMSKSCQVSSRFAIPVRWTKSLGGWHKLNTDGASCGNPGKAGGGGVIRDCHGDWVKGFSRSIGHTTSVVAEWWALSDGQNLAIQLGISQLEIELDAKMIVEMLKSTNCPNRSFTTLPCNYRCLMARFRQVLVGHVFREANKCANLLAKKGCSLMENFVVFDTSPFDELNVLLEADRNGLYYYRHIANTLATWPFCNCFCCLYKYLINPKKKKEYRQTYFEF